MSDSSQPQGLQPTRLLRPWDFPGKSTGVGCHHLLPVPHERPTNQTPVTLKCRLLLFCATVNQFSLDYAMPRKVGLSYGLSSRGAQAQLPHGVCDPSFLTRGQTHIPCTRRQTPNHWVTREVPRKHFLVL